jgi:hypothetical protein
MSTCNPFNPDDPVQALRLRVGDFFDDFQIFPDEVYQSYLDANGGNLTRASFAVIPAIIFALSRFTRERTGDIEVYGNEWVKSYKDWLLAYLKNPNISPMYAGLMPYAGGISKTDMAANDANCDNVRPDTYIGFQHEPIYNNSKAPHVYEAGYLGPDELSGE